MRYALVELDSDGNVVGEYGELYVNADNNIAIRPLADGGDTIDLEAETSVDGLILTDTQA